MSRLRLRLSAEEIPTVLPLAGKSLNVCSHAMRVGVPQVLTLVPAPNLMAQMVAIQTKERSTTPERSWKPADASSTRWASRASWRSG